MVQNAGFYSTQESGIKSVQEYRKINSRFMTPSCTQKKKKKKSTNSFSSTSHSHLSEAQYRSTSGRAYHASLLLHHNELSVRRLFCPA
jgi:hypothetical protein